MPAAITLASALASSETPRRALTPGKTGVLLMLLMAIVYLSIYPPARLRLQCVVELGAVLRAMARAMARNLTGRDASGGAFYGHGHH